MKTEAQKKFEKQQEKRLKSKSYAYAVSTGFAQANNVIAEMAMKMKGEE